MRTDWKSLKGKRALIKLILSRFPFKTYGEIMETEIFEVSSSGVNVKIQQSPLNYLKWYHRDEIKLVEVLE